MSARIVIDAPIVGDGRGKENRFPNRVELKVKAEV